MRTVPVLLALAVFSAYAGAQPLPAGHPGVSPTAAGKDAAAAQLPQKAKVLSTIAAAPYIYLEVKRGCVNACGSVAQASCRGTVPSEG